MYEGMIQDGLSRIGKHLAQQAQLFHPELITSSLQFADLVSSLLISWGSLDENGEPSNMAYNHIPDFLVEDLGDSLTMCARHGGAPHSC